ncbi:hypothetical protein PCO31111_01077 [Pandoraea communis]|uniref:Uncharacterized protein n=2 Tax=Pandoraea communis TaxID=2508297 RepID=A0A5E4T189_9BURK|nr:hypothetical protein [Pandoraea communis]VVD80204.1 hypothetical protein PCO31111_01077 [Pandoraea communis]
MFRRSLWLILSLWCSGAYAQQVGVYPGDMKQLDGGRERTYAWSFDYQQPIHRYFDVSFTWLNEGHVTNHHRDGFALQFWAHREFFAGRFDAGIGLGPYTYFDTVATGPDRSYENKHGVGMMYSAYLAWYFRPHWAVSFRTNWVRTHRSIDTATYMLGVRYRFNDLARGEQHAQPAAVAGKNTLYALGGLSVVNSRTSQNAPAYSVEYRHAFNDWFHGAVAFINEGKSDIGYRQGMTAQLSLGQTFLSDRLGLSVGFGPYFTWHQYHANPEAGGRRDVVSGLLTMGASYSFSKRWVGKVAWSRVMSRSDRDSDIFLTGIGFKF